jgi:hypothetical protein
MNKGLVCSTVVLLLVGLTLLPAQEKQTKNLKVIKAELGKDVQNKVLVDTTKTFAVNEKAYLWMRLTGGPADSITVTWKTGNQSYSSKLNIGGSPWRTWSYKTLADTGAWTVTVTDAGGTVLKEMNFEVKGDKPKQ